MKDMLTIDPRIIPIALLLSFILFIVWVIRRRIKIRALKNKDFKGSFSALQIFGIIGIIVFMLPLFFIVASYLARGVVFILFFLFSLFHFPETIKLIFQCITYTGMLFGTFAGTYYLCEKIWPKKIQINAD